MRVRVRAYAGLRAYLPGAPPGGAVELDLGEGHTVADALALLGIPVAEAKLCFVNGHRQEPDGCLQDGDELGIFPPIGGG